MHIMKMHSYMATNGYLESANQKSQAVLDELREATNAFGGWAQALSTAQEHREALDSQTGRDSTESATPIGAGTPAIAQGVTTSFVDADTAIALRKRLASVAAEEKVGEDLREAVDDPHKTPGPEVLQDHPDDKIAHLSKVYSDLQAELTSTGPHPVTYPNNITFKGFAFYQLVPSLVYELEYPRTSS